MKPRILVLNMRYETRPQYVDALTAYGAEPISLIYPEVSTDYDGLLLCGGADIDPAYYGQENCGSININQQRDESDMALAKAFAEAGKPILGICRGHQVLNVLFGGTLCQHMPTHAYHRGDKDAVHSVTAVGKSYLSEAYGQHFTVNSAHHQAVDKLGEGLRVTLKSDIDGMIEAFEHKTLPIIGVQWHPERITLSGARADAVDGKAVFCHFIALCSKQSQEKKHEVN